MSTTLPLWLREGEKTPEGDADDDKEEKRMEAWDFTSSRNRQLHSRYVCGGMLE
jgi:hypothetical protein